MRRALCVWAFLIGVVITHQPPYRAQAPAQETLQYIPFNYANDTRQLKTHAELVSEAQIWADMMRLGSYGTHNLTVNVWPYVTVPTNAPTDQSQCTTTVGFSAGVAARNAGYAVGNPTSTNFLFYRSPMDDNGSVCSHKNARVGLWDVVMYQYSEPALWLSAVMGRLCCSWTERWSNAAQTAFVTLFDYPNPAISMPTDQRLYFAWTGQGWGSWTAMERVGFGQHFGSGFLTTATNFYIVNTFPALGQSTTLTITPMDDDVTNATAKRAIIFNTLGFYCEARNKPESIDWDGGLNCFDLTTLQMLDMPPLPPWNGGQIPGMTSVKWALPIGGQYVDPRAPGERITLVSLSASGATVRLDHSADLPPCQVSPDGVVAATITDNECAVWTLGQPAAQWPGNELLLRNGVNDGGGIGSAYVPCSGVAYTRGGDNRWYRWGGRWDVYSDQQPCGVPQPPPPPPAPTWHDFTAGQLQQSDQDSTKFRACYLGQCVEFVWPGR